MKIITLSSVLVLLCNYGTTLNLPGPQVYVVTPSSRPWIDEARSAPQPFYYHNWIRRMDSPQNVTTTTTTAAPRLKTPDLIFAEFESDNMKNIRKLLEKEIKSKTTTTTTPKSIYVPDEYQGYQNNYGLPLPTTERDDDKSDDKTDYFAMYNSLYNNNAPVEPVYQPSTTTSTSRPTTSSPKLEESIKDKTDRLYNNALYKNLYDVDNAPFAPVYQPPTTTLTSKPTTSTTTTTIAPANNVENIWHIIDSEKLDQYSGQWNEVPIENTDVNSDMQEPNEKLNEKEKPEEENIQDDNANVYDNYALPGFGTESTMGGENESRAIRTEPNIRFPYVNLKPFQMKNLRKPLVNMFSNSKKANNNMFTNLDNFVEVKQPVRGEAQDISIQRPLANMPVDRYNPAQPYLPGPSEYGTKSKQSSPDLPPAKTYANLVPPPPPPPPKVTSNDFPAPSTYESFPPFASSGFDSAPQAPPSPPKNYQPPVQSSDSETGPGDDGPPDMGYRYKPPSPPTQNFLPTLPPLKKPFGGYSYDKPPMTAEAPPTQMDGTPDFPGYSYDQPAPPPEKSAFHGYHYDKPESPSPPQDDGSSYDHHGPPHHDSDYPELIYSKPHGGMDVAKGGDDANNMDSMGMVPPPMPHMKPGLDAHGPPVEDSGFPHDFPGDFKYHHDFDDHDFYHHHHHHTTTTTTTETPRVNRYSYYYLGKKLYYLPLYFSVYFIVYVAALIIKAVLRHKIVYPNSWRPNDQTAAFFSKRSVNSMDFSTENLHEITGRVTHAIATAAERYMKQKNE